MKPKRETKSYANVSSLTPRGLLFRRVVELLIGGCPFAIHRLALPQALFTAMGEPSAIAGVCRLQLMGPSFPNLEIWLKGTGAVLRVPIAMTDEELCVLVAGLPIYTTKDWEKVWAPQVAAQALAPASDRN